MQPAPPAPVFVTWAGPKLTEARKWLSRLLPWCCCGGWWGSGVAAVRWGNTTPAVHLVTGTLLAGRGGAGGQYAWAVSRVVPAAGWCAAIRVTLRGVAALVLSVLPGS